MASGRVPNMLKTFSINIFQDRKLYEVNNAKKNHPKNVWFYILEACAFVVMAEVTERILKRIFVPSHQPIVVKNSKKQAIIPIEKLPSYLLNIGYSRTGA